MTPKLARCAARLLAFLVSPLLTSPAAADPPVRSLPAASQRGGEPVALRAEDLARCGAARGHCRPGLPL